MTSTGQIHDQHSICAFPHLAEKMSEPPRVPKQWRRSMRAYLILAGIAAALAVVTLVVAEIRTDHLGRYEWLSIFFLALLSLRHPWLSEYAGQENTHFQRNANDWLAHLETHSKKLTQRSALPHQ